MGLIVASGNANSYNIRILISFTPFVLGVYLACVSFFGHDHNILAGLGCLVTSLAVTFFFFRWFVWGDFNFDNGSILAAIGGGLGLIGVLTGSILTKPGFVEVQSDLQMALLDASLNCKGNKQLYDAALASCSVVLPKEVLALSNKLIKARYLAPTLSLVDDAYHSTDDVKVDACLVNYHVVSKECPESFAYFNIIHPEFANPPRR